MRTKEKTVKAILIEKHANNKKSDSQAIRTMLRMKYAVNNNKPVKVRYYLEFMTKKGKLKFQVEQRDYNFINIDSLGELTYERSRFKSFTYIKKATAKDVEKLGW